MRVSIWRFPVSLAVVVAAAACDKSTAPAVPGKPARIDVTTGDGQSALAGTPLAQQLTLTVRDGKGLAVPNVNLTLAVSAGGGSVTPTTGVTSATGQVSGISWTLGVKGGDQTLTATVDSVSQKISATIQSSFPVTLRFFGPTMSTEAQAAFTNAAARIRAAVVGITGVAGVSLVGAKLDDCGASGLTGTLNESTTGIIIYAAVAPIDGVGKVLAKAGPCYVRDATVLPAVGVMQFDAADIQNYITTGRFEAVVLHEMNHVVGFGTIWTDKFLLKDPAMTNDSIPKPTGSLNPRFTGSNAITSCLAAGGSANHCAAGVGVAVEQCGGDGTADGHWRESFTTTCTGSGGAPVGGTPAFDAELMTGYAESTANMPWSAMTISSFRDLGYNVNLLAADPFQVPSLLTLARLRAEDETGVHPTEVVTRARFRVTGAGRVISIKREAP